MQMQRMQSDQATTVNSTFAESRIADKSSRGLFGEYGAAAANAILLLGEYFINEALGPQ
jgi:hypothetical protein